MTLTHELGSVYDEAYWGVVKEKARELQSDGCSVVPDFYVLACYEHDIHYRTHKTVYGDELTKEEADYLLGQRIRQLAWKNLSLNPVALWNILAFPMSIWRVFAVKE